MRGQRASVPVRLAGLAAAAALAVLAGAVAVRLAGRRSPAPVPVAAPPPEGRAVDVKERVRHEEYRLGKLHADIRGASFFLGPDGRNHLLGAVEIVNYSPEGEVQSRLTAGEVVYDPGATRFTVTGGVRVEAGGAVLEGPSFDHDKEAGLFGTVSGGAFAAESVTGRAATVRYAEKEDEVRLAGGFRVEISAAAGAAESAVLTGEELVYRRRERRGLARGEVTFSGPGFRGEAAGVTFVAAGDGRGIASAVFEAGPGGPARLELTDRSGPETDLRAAAIEVLFGPGGAAKSWSAAGDFRAGFGATVLEGAAAAFDATAGTLRAEGAPGRPASADSPEARVEAALLTAGPAAGDLAASGAVACLLKPGEGKRAGGFFAEGEAVRVSCDSLAFRGGAGSAALAGRVQARQGEALLEAGEMSFSDAEGELRAGGGVAAGLSRPAAGDGTPGGRIELAGDVMTFSAAGRLLAFRGRSRAAIPEARLEAGAVSAVLDGAGSVASVAAGTEVVLSKGAYRGLAGAAVYLPGPGRIVLTGRPVLTDGKGGATRGDKLTLDLADDKISVENEGQGRSATVVKS